MHRLLEGARRFQSVKRGRYHRLFRQLAQGGQRPHTLFITCADSRVVAELVTDSQPGELFVVKNVGNLVPPAGVTGRTNSTAAAVEFAADLLRVSDIVVCGHSHCGAIGALLRGATDRHRLPHLAEWLELAEPLRRSIQSTAGGRSAEERFRAAEQENVLHAMANLRTYPIVQTRMADGSLRLHGWFFNIATCTLWRHDAGSGQFVPLVTEAGS